MQENELTPEQVVAKFEAKIGEATKGLVGVAELDAVKSQLLAVKELTEKNSGSNELKAKMVELESSVLALKEVAKNAPQNAKTLVSLLAEKASGLKTSMKQSSQSTFALSLKALQNPSDVGNREDYAEFLEGTIKKPVRRTRVLDLFRRQPTSKEFIKYREENVVTRDGRVVVACAGSENNTKKTWVNRVVHIQKIKAFTDICLDVLDDYSFVAGEIEELITQAVKLKEESELLFGTGDFLSIDAISSEFDPANVLAPYTGAFQSATLAELTSAMKAQIYTFGQENAWDANVILMNYNDYVKFMHQKNADGDYLLPNFVVSGINQLSGMEVVTSPLVSPNTLYVMDTTKGVILDRKDMSVEMSYENNDNFENEIATLKAYERLQFHVAQINRDAFMKCTDIAQALIDITAPEPVI